MELELFSHNVLRTLGDRPNGFRLWREDLRISSLGDTDVTCYNECGHNDIRGVLREWVNGHNKDIYHPVGSANAISYNRDWERVDQGVVLVHKKHPTAKYNPERDFIFVGLKKNGFRMLVINVHPSAGYAKPENLTPWGDKLDAWKNWSAMQYWLDIVSFVTNEMSKGRWDCIWIIGDYNALLSNEDEWYYPGVLLSPFVVFDKGRALDHMCVTVDSEVHPVERESFKGNTDHRIHRARTRTT